MLSSPGKVLGKKKMRKGGKDMAMKKKRRKGLVTTGTNPTGVPYVRALILVPGGKVHQKLIQFRVYQADA